MAKAQRILRNLMSEVCGLRSHAAFLGMCLFVILAGVSQAADKVILKNNSVIEGRVIEEKDGLIVIELVGGKGTMGIPGSDILKVIMEKPEAFRKAEEAFRKRKFGDAIRLYNEVISMCGMTEWGEKALMGLGRAYTETNKEDDACRVFRRLVSECKDPDIRCESRLILGRISRGRRMYDMAKSIYGEILEEECSGKYLAEAQISLGEMCVAAEEYEEALLNFLRVVVVFYKQDEFVQKAMLRSGFCYEKLGDFVNAKRIYKELLREYPDGKHVGEAREKLNKLDDKRKKGEKR